MFFYIYITFALVASGGLFAHVPSHPQTTPHPLAALHKELELFSKNGIFEKINYTKTFFGQTALKQLMENPLTDSAALRARQEAIAFLCKNNDLSHQVTQALALIQATMVPQEALNQKLLQQLYFGWPLKKLNSSPAFLTALAYTYPVLDFLPVATHTLMPMLGFYLGAHSCNGHLSKKTKLQGIRKLLGPLYIGLASLHAKEIVTAPVHYWNSPSRYTTLELMHAQVQQVAQRMRAVQALYTILHNTHNFTQHIKNWNALYSVCTKTNVSDKLKQLLELLESNTFLGGFSRFSKAGTILTAYQLLQEVGIELQEAFAAIGEIDALQSCAELVKKHGFTFVQYDTAQEPSITIKNIAHPFLPKTATKNSITLGAAYPRNAMLSGPSTSGKSTMLKSIGLCYLGQTIGLVPAQHITMTPFDTIVIMRETTDDTQNGNSKFERVALKLNDILIQATRCAQENKRMLVLIDDGIHGINSALEERALQNFLQALLPMKQVITVMATHSSVATTIAEKSEHCTNYTLKNHVLQKGVGDFDNATELLTKKHPELLPLFRVHA